VQQSFGLFDRGGVISSGKLNLTEDKFVLNISQNDARNAECPNSNERLPHVVNYLFHISCFSARNVDITSEEYFSSRMFGDDGYFTSIRSFLDVYSQRPGGFSFIRSELILISDERTDQYTIIGLCDKS
jgi:hypothetical protein